nr:hypothetical protein [Tanacetum cinerariifolium]
LANALEWRLDVLGQRLDTSEAGSNRKKEYGKTFAPVSLKDVHELFHHSQLIQVYLNSKAADGADIKDPKLTLLAKGLRNNLLGVICGQKCIIKDQASVTRVEAFAFIF